MATATSVSPTAVERSGSRRGQSQSTVTRSQSTRTRTTAVPTNSSPQRAHSTRHRPTSSRQGAVEEVLPQANYETSNVARYQEEAPAEKTGSHRVQNLREAALLIIDIRIAVTRPTCLQQWLMERGLPQYRCLRIAGTQLGSQENHGRRYLRNLVHGSWARR